MNKGVYNLMPVRNYRDDLLVRLSDPNYSSEYLNAALEETLQDGNLEVFLIALKNIIDAKPPIQESANLTNNLQKKFEKLLNNQEELPLKNLIYLLHSVGITIDFKPLSEMKKMTLP